MITLGQLNIKSVTEYYAYRIFLNELVSSQTSLFKQTKEENFKLVFSSIEESIHVEFNDWGTNHIVFHYKKLNENIVVWQFARKQDYVKHVPTTERIENVNDHQYPYIFIVFHLEYQIALIQKNTSVFQDIDSVKSKLSRFFTERLPNYISVSFNEISEQKEFWQKIGELDRIEEVNFEFNPPNFFRGNNVFDKIVKESHEETNFETLQIYFKNKINGLKFQYDVFKEYIQRLSSGAGKYIVDGLKDGVKTRIASFIVPFKITIINLDELNENQAESDFKKVNELNEDEKQ